MLYSTSTLKGSYDEKAYLFNRLAVPIREEYSLYEQYRLATTSCLLRFLVGVFEPRRTGIDSGEP